MSNCSLYSAQEMFKASARGASKIYIYIYVCVIQLAHM